MPKYAFVSGRYESGTGKRIRGKVTKTEAGKLSTLTKLRYGQTTRKQVPKSEQKQKVTTKEGDRRNVLRDLALSKRTAINRATKYAREGKFEDALIEAAPTEDEANHLIKGLMAMAERVEAPREIKEMIANMDPYRAYTLAKVNRLSIETVFDYGFTLEDEIVDGYVSKWDDLMTFIQAYEDVWKVTL